MLYYIAWGIKKVIIISSIILTILAVPIGLVVKPVAT